MNFYQVEPEFRLAVDSVVSIGVVAGQICQTAILLSHCPSSGRGRFTHRHEAVQLILHEAGRSSAAPLVTSRTQTHNTQIDISPGPGTFPPL